LFHSANGAEYDNANGAKNDSANGAKYNSQGQARSASPLDPAQKNRKSSERAK
jgi:hypothetical protein